MEGLEDHPKCVKLRIGGGSVTLHVYLRTYTISLDVFSSIFVLKCLVLFVRNLTLSSIKKKCVHQKRLFFSNKINFCRHEISFFYLKLFLRSKVSQNAFNFNQIVLHDAFLWKNPLQRSAGNKVYFFFFFFNFISKII